MHDDDLNWNSAYRLADIDGNDFVETEKASLIERYVAIRKRYPMGTYFPAKLLKAKRRVSEMP